MPKRFLTLVVLWLAGSCGAALLRAEDSLQKVQSSGVLRWGADAEGGGPFVYPRDDDPTKYQGFEYEIADLVAAKLGVKAEFNQGQWDKLPELLERGDLDVVINGFEWKPMRAERFGMSLPYYIYQLQMLVRKDDERLKTLDDLKTAPDGVKWKVAVLGASTAEENLEQNFGDSVERMLFDGSTDAMHAVERNIDGLDGTLQDLCVATHYADRFQELRPLGKPFAPGYYVMLTRKEDESLLRALNQAILDCTQDGSIPKVLRKYGMWDELQQFRGLMTDSQGNFLPELAPEAADGPKTTPEPRWLILLRRLPLLVQGALVTIFLSVTSMPLAIAAGLAIAVGRLYGPTWIRPPLGWYVEIIRGTPLVLQLYVIFFLLPEFGLAVPPLVAAIIGLAINYSAYEAEIYRAGLLAIPRGQMEAALSLGMPRSLALRKIVIPQAFRLVIPPVMNDFIALFKDTAVCSVITIVELSKQYYIQAQSTGAVVELGIVTAIFYMGMSYPLTLIVGRMERKLAEGHR